MRHTSGRPQACAFVLVDVRKPSLVGRDDERQWERCIDDYSDKLLPLIHLAMPPKPPTTSARPFRILALPLARLPTSPGHSNSHASPSKPRTPLLLFQVHQPPPSPEKGPPPMTTRALQKAADTWQKLGDKPKDSWMYWFYSRGEGLMDRIEYEEWSLKSVIPGQGGRIASPGETQEKIEVNCSSA